MNNYEDRFSNYSLEDLVVAFNNEVGKNGWTNSRGVYLNELRSALEKTNIDVSEIIDGHSISLKYKVELQGNRLKRIIDSEQLEHEILHAWEESSITNQDISQISSMTVEQLINLLSSSQINHWSSLSLEELLDLEEFYCLLELETRSKDQRVSFSDYLERKGLQKYVEIIDKVQAVNKLIKPIKPN